MRINSCFVAPLGFCALWLSQAQAAVLISALPEGPGKVLVQKHCTKCHEPQWIEQAEGTESAWVTRIRRMIRRGSDIPANQVGSLASYLAQALPPRVREQAIAASPINTTVSEAAIRPVQSWIRVAGVLNDDSKDVVLRLQPSEATLIKIGQRARAFQAQSRSSMYQGQVVSVRQDTGGATVSVRLKSKSEARERYVLEIIADRGQHLSIPNEAIIEEGDRQLVYVQRSSGDYVAREIQTGIRGELFAQVVSGLSEGERVVTFGSFFIDAAYKMKAASPIAENESLLIDYRSEPDPPREGNNDVAVTVRQLTGEPVLDAKVALTYYMAAMPSMNMPEMRSAFALEHQGNGRYIGMTYISMPGTWLVTVAVTARDGTAADKRFTIVAK